MDNKYLAYRGNIRAMVGLRGLILFVTAHPEDQPTAFYRLDVDKLQLSAEPLPGGATCLIADEETAWFGGTDKHLYRVPITKGTPTICGSLFAAAPTALAFLARDRLAVLVGSEIHVLSRKEGKISQTLVLPEDGTVLASDPTGQWLVAGTTKGNVLVFECEDKAPVEVSASERLHEGAVTALLFEQEDLRFYSAGADNKLLSTHARGKLEAEDKGRGGNHTDQVTALLWGPADRFFSGSRDKTVKSWPRVSNIRPVTLKDSIIKVVALALVHLHKKYQLAVACDDNSIRFFALSEEGTFADGVVKIQDAYGRARSELNREEVPRREAMLRELASYADTTSIELISEQIGQDTDHGLRVFATQLLGAARHAKAAKLLEKSLNHADEAVRVAALEGLRKQLGESSLKPLDLALKVDKADVGRLAVAALEKLANSDDQALARLVEALNVKTLEVRQAALSSLEKVYGTSPEANLIALGSKHADLRRLTLIRLFHRHLLDDPKVHAVIRWRGEDADAEVRRTAFLLSLTTRPNLVAALRTRDPELDRQLIELETWGQDSPRTGAAVEPGRQPKRKKMEKTALSDDDQQPLLEATASRALDTCLRGGRALAVLHDPRAFGLLLQLSRESDTAARVEVCRAMAALEDPRSIKRLRSLLYDKQPPVRDAAFTALAQLYEDEPLQAAEAGLTAAFEDVRRRGLELLLGEIRKQKPANLDQPTVQLLVRALNDSFANVRTEAFKASLNLKMGGGGPETLRFVLQSIHADIRREVLTEVMAQATERWAWQLLLSFFNDQDAGLREEAFNFAVKRSKELEPLEAALCSRHPDMRKASVIALVKKHTGAAQALLARALTDSNQEIRQLALDALILDDAQVALKQALDSQHPDVTVRAARALARHGDPVSLPVLLHLATAAEPPAQEKARLAEWITLVEAALEGLALLGDPEAIPALRPLLESKQASHRKLAARALVWCVRSDDLEPLRAALQSSDSQVKYHAALGLAYRGDASVSSLVFSEQAQAVVQGEERLAAALTLGAAGEDQLSVFLDDADDNLRHQALVLQMLLELRGHDGAPDRCLASLSSQMPRVRLTAARALETFSDQEAFVAFVVSLFNDRSDDPPWKVTQDTIVTLAELVCHAALPLKAATVALLRSLSNKEQAAFDQVWSVHRKRYMLEIKQLKEAAKHRAARTPIYTPEQLYQLAFGAYVGLAREGGVPAGSQRSPGPAVVRVRESALRRILAMAQQHPSHAPAAIPVMVQALGDPNQSVRLLAFEQLQTLGMPSARLGAEALEAGHLDLGVKGLEVLTSGADKEQGDKVLAQVLLSRTDDLAIEAAKLLMTRRNSVEVATQALEAAHPPLRLRAVQWLQAEYAQSPAAQQALRQALTSRYQKVREEVAFALATLKDATAFAALVKLLQDAQDTNQQRNALNALVTLGDPRTPQALLDRLENDPSETALARELVYSAASFRQPELVDRLLGLLSRAPGKWKKACFHAVVTLSGYDQDLDDPDDESPNREWEKKQHPRHDAILTRLMEVCLAAGDMSNLTELMLSARWARGKEVDPVLAVMLNLSDDNLRQTAVEAIGWRLRKRGGSAEPLLKALQHSNPDTQFVAAEGLALAGRAEGFSVLLTSIDFLTDDDLRERAVLALGVLGDVRALDMLLKHANDSESPLREAAAEALGHMARSERAGEIFKMLERFSRGEDGPASRALRGLRWFNTEEAWKIIRQRAADPKCSARGNAIELLGFNDEATTRELLLKLLAEDHDLWNSVPQALRAARLLLGADSLLPDYAMLQNGRAAAYHLNEVLERVCTRGEPNQILGVLPRCNPQVKEDLARSVLNRDDLPVAGAKATLSSVDARSVELAAQILGRVGSSVASIEPALNEALERWLLAWDKKRHQLTPDQDEPADDIDEEDDFDDYDEDEEENEAKPTDGVTTCLEKLLWAAGRIGVSQETLLRVAAHRPEDSSFRPVRLAALMALTNGTLTPAVVKMLEEATQANDPDLRTLAAEALGRRTPAEAARIAETLLSDRASFDRLAAQEGVQLGQVLHQAAGQIHFQGIALPHLIAAGDLSALQTIAEKRDLPLTARLGALEGLALLASEQAETILLSLGQAKNDEEELRKAAWRGLKRSRRARKAKQQPQGASA